MLLCHGSTHRRSTPTDYGAGFPVLSLAAGQSAMTALVTIAIAGRDIVEAFSEASSVSGWAGMLWPNWNNPYEAGLVLWAGLGPEAMAFLLQLYGQRKTAAATAQVRWETRKPNSLLHSTRSRMQKPNLVCDGLTSGSAHAGDLCVCSDLGCHTFPAPAIRAALREYGVDRRMSGCHC